MNKTKIRKRKEITSIIIKGLNEAFEFVKDAKDNSECSLVQKSEVRSQNSEEERLQSRKKFHH